MKMKKNNSKYNSIILKNIVLESLEWQSSALNPSKYEFRNDGNGNIICTFFLNRDQQKYIVVANYSNETLTFDITGENGKKNVMSEREFAVEYYKDYDDFKKVFKSYIADDSITSSSKITPFEEVLKNVQGYETKDDKIYEIDGTKFIFRPIEDPLVLTYYECFFEQLDKSDKSKMIYYKVLLSAKPVNSVVIKIVKFDESGKMMEVIMPSDFLDQDKELYYKLYRAIKKLEKTIADADIDF